MRWFCVLLIIVSGVGCLDTSKPIFTPATKDTTTKKPVVVVGESLGAQLLANAIQEQQDIAGVATTIATNLISDKPMTSEEQGAFWEEKTKTIRDDATAAKVKLIEEAFQKTKTPAEAAAVWREIAKGYHVSR